MAPKDTKDGKREVPQDFPAAPRTPRVPFDSSVQEEEFLAIPLDKQLSELWNRLGKLRSQMTTIAEDLRQLESGQGRYARPIIRIVDHTLKDALKEASIVPAGMFADLVSKIEVTNDTIERRLETIHHKLEERINDKLDEFTARILPEFASHMLSLEKQRQKIDDHKKSQETGASVLAMKIDIQNQRQDVQSLRSAILAKEMEAVKTKISARDLRAGSIGAGVLGFVGACIKYGPDVLVQLAKVLGL